MTQICLCFIILKSKLFLKTCKLVHDHVAKDYYCSLDVCFKIFNFIKSSFLLLFFCTFPQGPTGQRLDGPCDDDEGGGGGGGDEDVDDDG